VNWGREVGILPCGLCALSRSGAREQAPDPERILPEHGLSPKIRDSASERAASGEGTAAAKAAEGQLWPSRGSDLASVWEVAGYPWSVRLKALLPLWMPWMRKRFQVSPEREKQLLRISPREIDRRFKAKKRQRKPRIFANFRRCIHNLGNSDTSREIENEFNQLRCGCGLALHGFQNRSVWVAEMLR